MTFTDLMNNESLKSYILTRSFHKDAMIKQEQLRNISKVIVHNAKSSFEVEQGLKTYVAGDYLKYLPPKSTEVHFYFKDGTMHISNPRSAERVAREINLNEGLEMLVGREIPLQIMNYRNNRVKANVRFREFAFTLCDRAFSDIEKLYESFPESLNLIFGPHESLGKSIDVILDSRDDERNKDPENDLREFLNYKIIALGDKLVLAFDYVFSDQARDILETTYHQLNARYSETLKNGERANVNIFHYGKVGILNSDLDVGTVAIPSQAMDELKMKKGEVSIIDLNNRLAQDNEYSEIFKGMVNPGFTGMTLNSNAVLRQKRANLIEARDKGCAFIDMEWAAMAGLDLGMSNVYPAITVNHFFAGVGSDTPLTGKTLGNTSYPAGKEGLVASAMLYLIANIE